MFSGEAIVADAITRPGNLNQHMDAEFTAKSAARRTFYVVALIASIATWFLAIRAPLRVDETGSYWQISAGFAAIWARQFTSFPAYSCILWLFTKLIGTSEIALRTPSVLAMLGATYLLYLSARELVGQEFAVIATIIFSLNPMVVFEAIDVRPYPFAILFTNAAILTLLRLRTSRSNWLAALFGLLAAAMVYFHYLFAAILPALLLCLIAFKAHDRKALRRQGSIAIAFFTFSFLPMLPGLQPLFRSAGSHVTSPGPTFLEVFFTIFPGWLLPAAALTALFTIARMRSVPRIQLGRWRIWLCISLALIPALILFVVAVATKVNVFSANYHRLSAIPGISLLWAMAIYRFRSLSIRIGFCALLVAMTVGSYVWPPISTQHDYSWKYALQVAQENTTAEKAPVVICSNFIESDYATMPTGPVTDSILFAPLSYYRLAAPVIPLPEMLNDETARVFLPFLKDAEQKHERFLALGHLYSSKTLDWMTETAAEAYTVHTLGVYDRVKVLEFVPRDNPATQKR